MIPPAICSVAKLRSRSFPGSDASNKVWKSYLNKNDLALLFFSLKRKNKVAEIASLVELGTCGF